MGFSIDLPTRIGIRKKGPAFALNLNPYRNANYFDLNKVKAYFTQIVVPQVRRHRLKGQVRIRYVLWREDRTKVDVSNICCIVDKFFSDALVEAGCIQDDNWTQLPEVSFSWGGIDKANPRVVATVEEIVDQPPSPERSQDVKIIVTKAEVDAVVQQALQNYIRQELNLGEDRTVTLVDSTDGYEVELGFAPKCGMSMPELMGNLTREAQADLASVTAMAEEDEPAGEYVPEPADRDIHAPGYLSEVDREKFEKGGDFKVLHGTAPVEADEADPSTWFDAAGNPVTEFRFVGKTAKQIGGMKGADNRATRAKEATEKAKAGFATAYPDHARKEPDFEAGTLEDKPAGLVPPMDNVPVQETESEEEALDRKMDEAIAKPDPVPAAGPGPVPPFMARMQAEAEAKRAAAEAVQGVEATKPVPARPNFLAHRQASQQDRAAQTLPATPAGTSLFPNQGSQQEADGAPAPVKSPRLMFANLSAPKN